jgi:hypothetical protein
MLEWFSASEYLYFPHNVSAIAFYIVESVYKSLAKKFILRKTQEFLQGISNLIEMVWGWLVILCVEQPGVIIVRRLGVVESKLEWSSEVATTCLVTNWAQGRCDSIHCVHQGQPLDHIFLVTQMGTGRRVYKANAHTNEKPW